LYTCEIGHYMEAVLNSLRVMDKKKSFIYAMSFCISRINRVFQYICFIFPVFFSFFIRIPTHVLFVAKINWHHGSCTILPSFLYDSKCVLKSWTDSLNNIKIALFGTNVISSYKQLNTTQHKYLNNLNTNILNTFSYRSINSHFYKMIFVYWYTYVLRKKYTVISK